METIPFKEIVQLGGLAVVSIGVLYILFVFIKEHRKELNESRKERIESYNWFQGYVSENNHDQTERFKEHTQALVDVTKESANAMNAVAKNIEANTSITKKHGDILENHSKILEKVAESLNEIRFKIK